jgi:hypothetical protein
VDFPATAAARYNTLSPFEKKIKMSKVIDKKTIPKAAQKG